MYTSLLPGARWPQMPVCTATYLVCLNKLSYPIPWSPQFQSGTSHDSNLRLLSFQRTSRACLQIVSCFFRVFSSSCVGIGFGGALCAGRSRILCAASTSVATVAALATFVVAVGAASTSVGVVGAASVKKNDHAKLHKSSLQQHQFGACRLNFA